MHRNNHDIAIKEVIMWLLSLIKQKRTTSEQVAIECGVHPAQLSRYLNGWRLPSAEVKEKIAGTLDVSPGDIQWEIGKPACVKSD
ncbi:helix-turn-helix domain-containing protein [Candidatus Riflebacteria bacterium]